MRTIVCRLAGLLLLLSLAACAGITPTSTSTGRDYFPGGAPYYSYGVSQSAENFANVERAQSSIGMYSKERNWTGIRSGLRAPSHINLLQAYYPLSVRWQLKDGRQFIAENIDVRALMREYFAHRDIPMPWQKEGRQMAVGDSDPSFVHEIKDDSVILKWLVITNLTPVAERLTATGAANRWRFSDEEYVVTAVKGTPTDGIDFDKRHEFTK